MRNALTTLIFFIFLSSSLFGATSVGTLTFDESTKILKQPSGFFGSNAVQINSAVSGSNKVTAESLGARPSYTLGGYTNRLTWQGIVVDSRPFVQAAIDDVAARGGGVVQLGPGDWRFGNSTNAGTLYLKPRVALIGTGSPMSDDSYEGTYSATNVIRISHSTMLHFAGGSTNGYGAPCIALVGNPYYTNQYYQAFADALGDWVAYYRGGNTIANLGIWSGWQWAWNSSNAPAAGIYINEVAGTTIDNVFVGPTAGPGIYIRGGFGTRIFDSYVANNLAGGVVVVDTSDTWIDRTSIPVSSGSAVAYIGSTRSDGTFAQTANTHKLVDIAAWNNKEELSGWVGTSTSYNNGGVTENVGVPRTGWSVDTSADTIGIFSRIGSDTGLPVMVRGTSLPGGINTNTVYFVRWGTQGGTNFQLCLTAGRALNGGAAVDLTSSGGSDTWWLESPSSVIFASDAQEIQIEGARMDQSWSTIGEFRRSQRTKISGVHAFEVGLNQTEVRQSRKQTFRDPNVVAFKFIDCSDVSLTDNQIVGSKGNTSLSTPWIHNPIGVSIVRGQDFVISGNLFDRVNSAILVDSESANINTDGNAIGGWVSRPLDSGSTYGIEKHVPYFDAKTNSQIVASIPVASTNISGDFAIAIKARVPSMTTNGWANGRHSALLNLTSVTNTTSYGSLVPRSLVLSFWRSIIDNSMNVVGTLGGTNYDPATPSTERFAFGSSVTPFMGQDIEILVQRVTNYVQVFVEGIRVVNSAATGSTTGTVYAPYLVMGQVGDSGQFSHSQAPIYGIALHVGKAFTSDEVNQGVPWARKGGTNAVVLWDFAGASLTGGVLDLSGNGINGTVQQIGAVAPEFGTSDDISITGTGVTRTGKKSWTLAGAGVTDGDKGDITVSGSGSTFTIDADAVALATDTTGNFVATVVGTANEVSVSGSGSENASVTLSLPSTIDLGGKTSFELPNGAATTVDAFGEIAGDNDAWAASRGAIVAYDGTSATRLVGVLSSDTPSNGQVPVWNTGGTITWENQTGSTSINTNGGFPGAPIVLNDVLAPVATNSMTVSNLTVAGALTITSPIDVGSITNAMATDAEVAAGYQPLDSDLTDLADGSLTGSKVGTGIDAANITTGTLDNARLDADLQDLADGTLSGSKVGSGIDGANITTGTTGTGNLVRESAAGGSFAWDVDQDFDTTNTSGAVDTVYTVGVPLGSTKLLSVDVLASGDTNAQSWRLYGRLSNRSGGTMATNWVLYGGSTDTNSLAYVTNSGTNLLVMVRGPSYQPQHGNVRGWIKTITNAGAYSSTPSLDTNGLRLVWRFDEAVSTDRTSDDGYALVLYQTNTVNYVTSGVRSNAARFSRASSQSLGRSTTNLVEVTNENFTVTAWVNPSSFPSSGQIYGVVGKCDPGVNARVEWSLQMRYNAANTFQFDFLTGTNGAGSGTHTIASTTLGTTTNTWYFLAAGRDSTVSSNWISVNGSEKEYVASPIPGPTSSPFRVGLFGSATHFMNGVIDEVTFWRTNLTPTQISFMTNQPPPTLP